MKLAYAFCGSFCTHSRSLEALKALAGEAEITPVLSEITRDTSTRFGTNTVLRESVTKICGRDIIESIKQAEEVITRGNYDALIISPCTGNTLSKIALGTTDTVVTMCAKAQLRCRRPVIIALATNDGLGANLQNIAKTVEKKNIYFVPFGQDDPLGKNTSLVCDFGLIPLTLENALRGVQIQPILL